MSASRSGAWVTGRASSASASTSSEAIAYGLSRASRRLRAATSARSRSETSRPASNVLACNAARLTVEGHRGATVYGSACSVKTSCTSERDDFPKP